MNELPRFVPDVQVLLALTPEELAEKMLFILKKRNDNCIDCAQPVPTEHRPAAAFRCG